MFQRLRRYWTGYWALGLVLALVAGAASRADTAIDPAVTYAIAGTTPAGGREYKGRLEIVPHGPAHYLSWRLDSGETYAGVALLEGHVLGAVYWAKPGPSEGVVIYRIDGDTLTGTWAPAVGPILAAAGRETLKGSPALSGRYDITLGQNPDNGKAYTGHVEMKRTGDTYELRWFVPSLAYVGRGIRVGDLLVVGYGQQSPGVVAYCMSENGGDGLWSVGDSRGVGREMIAREGAAAPAAIMAECSGQGI